MFNLAKTLFVLTVFTVIVPITAVAQTFELPEARAGEHYRVQIEQVLRDAYRLKLETGSQDAVVQWALENGDLPPGLAVRADGFILGKPDASRDGAFAFRLRVHDPAAKNDALVLEFVMKLKSGGLRLVKFEGPTLRPVDEPLPRPQAADGGEGGNGSNGAAPKTEKAPVVPSSGNGENGSNVSQNPFSSRNRRFIVGFEQSGVRANQIPADLAELRK